jgi:predicted metal-dependent peptidase
MSSQIKKTYTDPDQVIRFARAAAIQKMPYFKALYHRMILVPVPGLNTAGMSQWGHLVYDPDRCLSWANDHGLDALAGVVAHEAMHWLLDHAGRRGARDPKLYNIAADLYINASLRNAGMKLPPGVVWPELFTQADGSPFPETATADRYYDLLRAGATIQPGEGQGEVAAGNCGTGAGNEPLQGEPTTGDSEEHGGIGQTDREKLTEDVAKAAAEHAEKNGAGSVPLGFDRWVENAKRPKVAPWPDRVAHALETDLNRLGRGRRIYRRPSRRQASMAATGLRDVPVLPVRASTKTTVWLVIDTSGSMSDKQLELGIGLVQAQCARRGVALYVFSCDADISGPPKRVSRWQDARHAIKGGGGTDFRPIFQLYEDTSPQDRPNVIQVWTDGDGPAPKEPPSGNVVVQWILSCPWGEPHRPALWGDVVAIGKDELES